MLITLFCILFHLLELIHNIEKIVSNDIHKIRLFEGKHHRQGKCILLSEKKVQTHYSLE